MNGLNESCAKIGETLKAYREKVGLKQTVVAQLSGISTSMLSQIERSLVSPSVSTLFSVCRAMGMDIVDLFKSVNQKNPIQIHHPIDRSIEESDSVRLDPLIMRTSTEHFEEMNLMEIKPGKQISLSGREKNKSALGFVLAGTVTFEVEEASYILKKGDSLYLPYIPPHTYKNTGKTSFKVIWCLIPDRQGFVTSH